MVSSIIRINCYLFRKDLMVANKNILNLFPDITKIVKRKNEIINEVTAFVASLGYTMKYPSKIPVTDMNTSYTSNVKSISRKVIVDFFIKIKDKNTIVVNEPIIEATGSPYKPIMFTNIYVPIILTNISNTKMIDVSLKRPFEVSIVYKRLLLIKVKLEIASNIINKYPRVIS